MKKIIILLLAMLVTTLGNAQNPTGFSYQAVVRNAAGELIKNKTIGMRITILEGSATGP